MVDVVARATEFNDKNIYVLHIGASLCYNLGQLCLSQIRVNVVTNWGSFIITNWGKCCYKLGQLLQVRATVITK